MQISVTGKQLEIGDSLREHIEHSLTTVVEKYFGNAIEAAVVLSRDAHKVRADVGVHIGRGIHLRSHEASADAYSAFDIATGHMSKRLRRYKRRLRDHHSSKHRDEGTPTIAQQYVLAPEPEIADADSEAATGEHPVVIAEAKTEVESLSVSEAVMRMDLADLSALVFHNAAHGGLNVIYRRADGNVGWIDPGAT